MSKNDITGDEIKSRINSKAYEDNYESIFKKDILSAEEIKKRLETTFTIKPTQSKS